MTDPRAIRLSDELRERTSHRAACDPADVDTHQWFSARLDGLREVLRRDDIHRLQVLGERLCGVRTCL